MHSLWILASSFLFTLCALFVKLLDAPFTGFELVFYRSIFGVAIMLTCLAAAHDSVRTQHLVGHFKRSTAAWLSMVMWMAGLPLIPLATSMTLGNTTPIVIAGVVIFLSIIRKQSISWKLIAAILSGFAGIVLMLRPTFSPSEMQGCLLIVGSCCVSAYSYFQIRELSVMHESSYRIVFYVSLFGFVYSLACVLIFERGFTPVDMHDFICLCAMGLSAGFGQLCLTFGFGKGNMLLSSCLQYSSIVFSQIFGFFLFSETLDGFGLAGMALIAVSGVYATMVTSHHHKA